MAYRSLLYGRKSQTMQSPLSASTPQLGVPNMDPLKTPSAPQAGGYNPQSAANAQSATRKSASAMPNVGAAPSASPVQGYLPPPPPPPTQPNAPVPPPAAAVTRQAATAPVSPRVFPGPGGQMLTKEEYDKYTGVLNQNGIPAAVQRGGASEGTPSTAAGVGGQPAPAEAAARAGQTYNQPSVYDDPLIQSLLKEVQGRISGDTTASTQRMNDRAQQQANAAKQDVDRRLSGRGIGAGNPVRDKMYSDIDQNVRDQMALRDADLQQQSLAQGTQLFGAVQQAKNVDAFKQQIAQQQQQFNASLAAQEKQNDVTNPLAYLGAAGSLISGAPTGIAGIEALKKFLGFGGSSSSSPLNTEQGFRLNNPRTNPFGSW